MSNDSHVEEGRRSDRASAGSRERHRLYSARLGHDVRWRNDVIGQAGLALPDSDTEIVLTVVHGYEPNWLVESVDDAVIDFVEGGGTVVVEPADIPVGRLGVVADPFGNVLVLVDLSKGRYEVDDDGQVTGVIAG